MIIKFMLSLAITVPFCSTSGAAPLVLDPSAIDPATSPCQDFYQYACGSWLRDAAIPSDKESWSRAGSVVSDDVREKLKRLFEGYASGDLDKSAPYAAKIGAYYSACMDEAAVERTGPAELKRALERASAPLAGSAFARFIAKLHLEGNKALFDFDDQPDFKNPRMQISGVMQAGLGLPNQTYYVRTDERSQVIRAKYREHMKRMLTIAGLADAAAESTANDAFAFEDALAKFSLAPEDMRDASQFYHPAPLQALREAVPNFDWTAYFAELSVAPPASLNFA